MTSRTGSVGGDFREVRELSLSVGRRRLTFGARQGLVAGVRVVVLVVVVVGGGRWKSQHRKGVYLSPYVEKPFNSKVIKSFVLELRSRKCFLCFGIPTLYIYVIVMNIMNVLSTGMNMSISHIHIWLCSTRALINSRPNCHRLWPCHIHHS